MKLTDQELDALLKSMELDEPSMSFNRNVMEQVKLESVPVILKTRVDKRIIYSIAGLFMCFIVVVVAYAVANTSFDYKGFQKVNVKIDFEFGKMISSQFLSVFLMVDAVIALIWLDRILRKKSAI